MIIAMHIFYAFGCTLILYTSRCFVFLGDIIWLFCLYRNVSDCLYIISSIFFRDFLNEVVFVLNIFKQVNGFTVYEFHDLILIRTDVYLGF